MGTCKNRIGKAIRTSTHNLCFLSRNKKKIVYPSIPQFYYIKVGVKGVKLYRYVFVMVDRQLIFGTHYRTASEFYGIIITK